MEKLASFDFDNTRVSARDDLSHEQASFFHAHNFTPDRRALEPYAKSLSRALVALVCAKKTSNANNSRLENTELAVTPWDFFVVNGASKTQRSTPCDHIYWVYDNNDAAGVRCALDLESCAEVFLCV